MRQRESDLSSRIKHALKARGHWAWKNHGSRFSEPGRSDLSGVRFGDGVAFAIETKLKTELTKAQHEFIEAIEIRSCYSACVGVARSVEDAIRIVETPAWLARFDEARRRFLVEQDLPLPSSL